MAFPSGGGQARRKVTFGEGQGTRYPVGQAERQLEAGPGRAWPRQCWPGSRRVPRVRALAAGGAPLQKQLPVVRAKSVQAIPQCF